MKTFFFFNATDDVHTLLWNAAAVVREAFPGGGRGSDGRGRSVAETGPVGGRGRK